MMEVIMDISDLVHKSQNHEEFSNAELVQMLSYPSDSDENYRIMAEGNRISRTLTHNRAEIHGQFSLNLSPCSCNCKFCSFSRANGIFTRQTEISVEDAVQKALHFEEEGVNAIFIMTTAHYSFEKFLEVSREIRKNLDPLTVMVANVGDKTLKQAQQIKDVGFSGVYHALRLREGTDTDLDPTHRKKSLGHFQEAGLQVGTCVEPVGPEHTNLKKSPK
jgi:biotin synthase